MGIPIHDREVKTVLRRGTWSSFVQLRVSDQHGREVHFKIRRKCPMGLLVDAYCEKMCLSRDKNHCVFLYKDKAISSAQTPEQLGMDEEAENYVQVIDS